MQEKRLTRNQNIGRIVFVDIAVTKNVNKNHVRKSDSESDKKNLHGEKQEPPEVCSVMAPVFKAGQVIVKCWVLVDRMKVLTFNYAFTYRMAVSYGST